MPKHIRRPTTRPPARIRVATANASATPLTGGLLAASARTAGAANSVTHHKADFNGESYGDVAFSIGSATASGQKNAGDFVALYASANGITSAKRTTSQNTTPSPGSSEAGDGFGRVSADGDFTPDGFDDLAIGAEYEKAGTDLDDATVAILQDSARGLPAGTAIAGSAASPHDPCGATLAANDINGDEYPTSGANTAN
ncbi:hypothetical protein [Streptomyces fractus]|uniref:hypothetical protein n=1 Tax=Streptomyces fractus TaxID=641806 RepID=UPI003CF2CCB4